MNYSLLAWDANYLSIELVQKKAVRVINIKSPLAHTEPILKGMEQLKLPDMYTCHLIKLYYKLYRNKLPTYFENFIPEYGKSQHDLRHNNIHVPLALRYTQLFTLMGIHYLNLLLDFPNTSSLNLFHCNINDCYTCQYS